MKIANQRELPCSQAQAWAALNDAAMLQACIPGCESLSREGEQMNVVVMAAVGPVRARFKGLLQLQDVLAPQSYAMRFEGQGGVAGFGKGLAQVKLSAISEQRCLLDYSAEVQIGGKLAQIGSRVVDAAAQKIIGDFFARFEQVLQQQAQPAAAPAPMPRASLWQRVWTWLLGCFGKQPA